MKQDNHKVETPSHSSGYYTQRAWDRAVGIGLVPPELDADRPENQSHIAALKRQEQQAAALDEELDLFGPKSKFGKLSL